ncbi:hypothetical protein ACFQLX_03610 [Streptomyces polyrhachis]|uniref:Tetratricopeptide repeat protein n=1 Tax=Streptomyces polyrhachis TaxID=1282885 RepID=A0ABW2GBV6_9ACTN
MIDPTSPEAFGAALGVLATSMVTDLGRRGMDEFHILGHTLLKRRISVPSGPMERIRLSDELSRAASQGLPQNLCGATFSRRFSPDRFEITVPRMLPTGIRYWTNRTHVFDCLLEERVRPGHGCRGAVLHGPMGVGVSSCAIAFGFQHKHLFTDGQLYADLRGSGHVTISAGEVLHLFLKKLGMPEDAIPPTPGQRAEEFRQHIAGRRLLVILDHVSDVEQVTPLLTDDENVYTLVVSSDGPMPGLPLKEMEIGPLDGRHPTKLVTSITSEKHVKANCRKARTAIRLCGGYPFALQALGEHMCRHPQRSWAEVGEELRTLAADVPDGDSSALMVRWLYQQLDVAARQLLIPLVVCPWPSFTSAIVAQAVGISETEAERIMSLIVDCGLAASCGSARYTIRESVRRHLSDVLDHDTDRQESTVRTMLDAYLRLAVHFDYIALPDRWYLNTLYDEAKNRAHTEHRRLTVQEALEGARQELPNFLEAVRTAHALGEWDTTWQLIDGLWALQLKVGFPDVLLPGIYLAIDATQRCGHKRAESRMRFQAAFAHMSLGQFEQADGQLVAALAAAESEGNLLSRASVLEGMALLNLNRGTPGPVQDLISRALDLLDGVPEGTPDVIHTLRARALLIQLTGRERFAAGEYNEALRAYRRALAEFDKAKDSYNQARVRMRMATVYRALQQPATAAKELDLALGVLNSQQASQIRSEAAEQRAACARELNRPDEAIQFLKIALRDHDVGQRPAAATKVRDEIEAHLHR